LTEEQWRLFAGVTLHMQAVRQAFEATLALPTLHAGGRYRLDIPAYPDAGSALKARLHYELINAVGPQPAAEIIARLGGLLEAQFGGFGVGVQTLDFTAYAGESEDEYVVTRTVKKWEYANGLERVSTRRETFFPGIEDPTGHTWGPFLSVLAAKVAEKTTG
jgi:hypothetical protein